MPRTHSSKRTRLTKVTIKLEKWGRDLSLVKQSPHHLLQPAELHYSPHNPTVPMTQTQRERSRDGNVKEECRKDGLIQAEACWHVRVFECARFYQTHREQERVSAADRKGLWKVHSLHRELATCAEKLKNPSLFFWRQRFKQGARLKYRGRIRRTPQNFLYSLVKVWTKFTSNTELRLVSIIHSCCTLYVQPRTHKDIRRQQLRCSCAFSAH